MRRLFERGEVAQVRADLREKIENILALLDAASRPEEMDLPGLRLHPLRRDLHGCWAVTVRANWRIVWRFEGVDVVAVDLTDYHEEKLAVPMKNPPHPGRVVRQECIEPLGLTITDAARALGVSRNAVSELVNERRGISPEMAIMLVKAFGGGAEAWHRMQGNYDMAQAMKDADKIKVGRVAQRV